MVDSFEGKLMRLYLILSLIFALLVAACGGDATTQAPPATVDPANNANATAVVQATQPPPAPTSGAREYATGEPPLPIPGTLVAPATEDPEAGLVFDVVYFNRTGGAAGQALSLQILSNGSGIFNDAAITISAEQVTQLDNLIDQIGFFGLQGVFTAPGTSAEVYKYDITVDRAGSSRSIKAQEGLIPRELAQLIDMLSQLAGQ
jgi:hypothetical protein